MPRRSTVCSNGTWARCWPKVEQPLVIDTSKKPYVILMVGVNGVGKTTTIGKLAKQFQAEGKSVMLAAGDTFRAAAVEQLQVGVSATTFR